MVIYNCINVHLKSSQTEENLLKEVTKKKINKFKVSRLKLSGTDYPSLIYLDADENTQPPSSWVRSNPMEDHCFVLQRQFSDISLRQNGLPNPPATAQLLDLTRDTAERCAQEPEGKS